jgi:hypothetical protein
MTDQKSFNSKKPIEPTLDCQSMTLNQFSPLVLPNATARRGLTSLYTQAPARDRENGGREGKRAAKAEVREKRANASVHPKIMLKQMDDLADGDFDA